MQKERRFQHQVSSIAIELSDQIRGRQISMRISYPQGHDVFPLIIFSHGAGASQNEYSALAHYWASEGYVVIQPTHADSLSLKNLTSNPEGLLTVLKDMQVNRQQWIDRVQDISFLIDSLPDIETKVPALVSRINTESIGLAGHSYGAFTTLLAAGARLIDRNTNQLESFAETRIKAFIVMSPPGAGQQDLNGHSFSHINAPLMVMTGSKDRGMQGQPPEWRCECFQMSRPGDKYLAFIQGASHFSFAAGRAMLTSENKQSDSKTKPIWPTISREDVTGKAIDQRVILTCIKNISSLFWQRYLNEDAEAEAILNDADFAELTSSIVQFSRK
jgi:predicted dienelactone hydrolase